MTDFNWYKRTLNDLIGLMSELPFCKWMNEKYLITQWCVQYFTLNLTQKIMYKWCNQHVNKTLIISNEDHLINIIVRLHNLIWPSLIRNVCTCTMKFFSYNECFLPHSCLVNTQLNVQVNKWIIWDSLTWYVIHVSALK